MAQLANLTTTLAIESASFVNGIEQSRGAVRRLVASLDPAAAAQAKFNRQMDLAERGLRSGQISADRPAASVEPQGVRLIRPERGRIGPRWRGRVENSGRSGRKPPVNSEELLTQDFDMPRRQRIDTIAGAVATMKDAAREIGPPAHVRLDDTDKPFWRSVLAEFARSEWTEHQLELAALLARTMADLEREQHLMRQEGSVLASERGTPVVNPRKAIIQMSAGTILSMRRSLSLNARAQKGDAAPNAALFN